MELSYCLWVNIGDSDMSQLYISDLGDIFQIFFLGGEEVGHLSGYLTGLCFHFEVVK